MYQYDAAGRLPEVVVEARTDLALPRRLAVPGLRLRQSLARWLAASLKVE